MLVDSLSSQPQPNVTDELQPNKYNNARFGLCCVPTEMTEK